MPPRTLSHHTALVTGASKGLGHAIAAALAAHGCSTISVARNSALLLQKSRSLPILSHSQSHKFVSVDLTQTDKLSVLEPHLQKTTILVNCAGITNHSLLGSIPDDEIVSTIELNLLAPILLSKLAFKPLLRSAQLLKKTHTQAQKPCILNVSSVLSLDENLVLGASVYSALKAGLNTLTKSLALEFKDRVRVNALLPGLIRETDMGQSATLDSPPVTIGAAVAEALRIIMDDSINGQLVSISS